MAATKLVTVYGTEKSKMATGKAYSVSEQLANTLLARGAATKNAPKEKKEA